VLRPSAFKTDGCVGQSAAGCTTNRSLSPVPVEETTSNILRHDTCSPPGPVEAAPLPLQD